MDHILPLCCHHILAKYPLKGRKHDPHYPAPSVSHPTLPLFLVLLFLFACKRSHGADRRPSKLIPHCQPPRIAGSLAACSGVDPKPDEWGVMPRFLHSLWIFRDAYAPSPRIEMPLGTAAASASAPLAASCCPDPAVPSSAWFSLLLLLLCPDPAVPSTWFSMGTNVLESPTEPSVIFSERISPVSVSTSACILINPRLTFHFLFIHSPLLATLMPVVSTA